MRRFLPLPLALAAVALAAPTHGAPPRLEIARARVCTEAEFDEFAELCTRDESRKPLVSEQFNCSAFANVDRPTRFTIRLRYEGQIQRSVSLVARKDTTAYLRVRFPNLQYGPNGDDVGLPGGSYSCEFLLGPKRVVVPFRSVGPRDRVLAAAACRPTGGVPIDPYCGGLTRGQAVACGAVFARLAGHPITVEILRGRGDAATLLYGATDTPTIPIVYEWAVTSAPPGQFLPTGEYECRFRVDGNVVAAKPFEIVK